MSTQSLRSVLQVSIRTTVGPHVYTVSQKCLTSLHSYKCRATCLHSLSEVFNKSPFVLMQGHMSTQSPRSVLQVAIRTNVGPHVYTVSQKCLTSRHSYCCRTTCLQSLSEVSNKSPFVLMQGHMSTQSLRSVLQVSIHTNVGPHVNTVSQKCLTSLHSYYCRATCLTHSINSSVVILFSSILSRYKRSYNEYKLINTRNKQPVCYKYQMHVIPNSNDIN